MTAELQRAHAMHAPLRGCTVERLCEALLITRDSPQTDASDSGNYSVPMSVLRRERVVGGAGVGDPGIVDSKVQDGHYKQFVQVLISYKCGYE